MARTDHLPEPVKPMQSWRARYFDTRELKEIEFCEEYAEKFSHGTDGHLVRTIVAKLARMLDISILDINEAKGLFDDTKQDST